MSNLDKLATDSVLDSANTGSGKKGKGGNIVATSAETSKIIAADAKTDAAVAASVYNRSFAAGYVAERQKGAVELQDLIVKAGQATRAAIESVDVDEIKDGLPAAEGEDAKKSLAGIFSDFF